MTSFFDSIYFPTWIQPAFEFDLLSFFQKQVVTVYTGKDVKHYQIFEQEVRQCFSIISIECSLNHTKTPRQLFHVKISHSKKGND